MADRNPMDKKHIFDTLLAEGQVYVHLDPRREGVVVPPDLKDGPMLTLVFGRDLPIPIPDLEVDQEAVTGTLSFNRTPFWCKIPWRAIYALSTEDGRALVWPDDLPQDIQIRIGAAQDSVPTHPRPRFGVLDGGLSEDRGAAGEESLSQGPAEPPGTTERQGHARGGAGSPRPRLRLVPPDEDGQP